MGEAPTSPFQVIRILRSSLARPEVAMLPARVKAIIEREDRASEHLVGLAQLAVAVTLSTLYLIAPRPSDAGMDLLQPVPVALTLFCAFSILRLRLIMRQPLPEWFVVLSIVADVGLVIGLIWAFHISYGEPPAFSLKAPTFVYLFILIVLRALRFDPRYVIAAGLAGAAGWALLTLWAVSASEAGTITRSFSSYLNSSRILIGAEIEKVLSILVVTALIAIGARRAQRTLVAALRDEAAAKEIGRFLSRGVAEQIASSQTLIEAGHAVEREAAVLMLDIRGFTSFAQSVPPGEVVRLLTGFHHRIIPIVRRHGGVIDKFLGDGVMATFGATAPSSTPAADALRALEEVLVEAGRWQEELLSEGLKEQLKVNAALASGRVVFAALGGGDRLELTVIGEAANLAAKLEKHNKVEFSRAVVPRETFDQGRSQGFEPRLAFDARPARVVAGVHGTIDIVAL